MDFIGNKKKVALLRRSLERHMLAHAYLFSGPERVGKYYLANAFAGAIVSGSEDLDFSRLEQGALAMDRMVVEPEIEEKKGVRKKRLISIERVREASADLNLYPYGGAYRVLIINDAHMLTTAAQNSLLKTLEEPNKTSVLILVTSDPGRILPTIKSRVQELPFSLVDDDVMRLMLQGVSDNKRISEYLLYAMGRPGLLRELLEHQDLFERRKEDAKLLDKLRSTTVGERLRIAEELSKDAVSLTETLSLWLWICKKQAVGASLEQCEEGYGMMEKIQACIETLKAANASARLALENLLISLRHV